MVREFFDLIQRAVLLCGLAVVLVGLATGLGCAPIPLNTAQNGPTVVLDPDVDDQLGGTGIESGDIRGASEQVSRGIAQVFKSYGATTVKDRERSEIAMLPVVNKTRFRIDPGLVQNRLTHDLVQRARGKFLVIPLDEVVDTATADYVLVTELRSETKDGLQGVKSDYVQYAFMLKRPTDGAVLWSGMYETKRKSAVDAIYQ